MSQKDEHLFEDGLPWSPTNHPENYQIAHQEEKVETAGFELQLPKRRFENAVTPPRGSASPASHGHFKDGHLPWTPTAPTASESDNTPAAVISLDH